MTEKKYRYALLIKLWKEGEETSASDSEMTTDSLRVARDEFRRRIRDFLSPCEISAEELRPIVADGYVVAAGPITPFADHLALMLVDNENPRRYPPMNAFTFTGDGWRSERYVPTVGEVAVDLPAKGPKSSRERRAAKKGK